jgi:hypothetical protein
MEYIDIRYFSMYYCKEKDAESREVFAVGSEISLHLTFFQDDAISNLT